MAYRKIPISRSRLIAAYWKQGYRQTLRSVAQELDISYNTARNWLIKFELYESYSPNRGRNNKVSNT